MSGGRGKRKCKKRFFWAIKAGCRGFPTGAAWCDPWGIRQGEAHGRGSETVAAGPYREPSGVHPSGKIVAPARSPKYHGLQQSKLWPQKASIWESSDKERQRLTEEAEPVRKVAQDELLHRLRNITGPKGGP